MNFKSKYFVLVVAIMSITPVANAACRKAQVCDDNGMNCKVQQVCDSTIDLPSIKVAPITPLPSIKPKPLPSLQLPPVGSNLN